MSWSEIKKAVNSDVNLPLNKAIGEMYDEDGDKYYSESVIEDKDFTLQAPPILSFNSSTPYGIGNYQKGATFEYNNKIYTIGNAGLYEFNPDYGNWKLFSTTIPQGYGWIVFHGKVHSFSNYNHYIFNMETKTKTTLTSLPTNYRSATGVVYNDELYVLCYNYNTKTQIILSKWNETNDSWDQITTKSRSYNFSDIFGFYVNETDNYIGFLCSGVNSGGSTVMMCAIYNFSTGQITIGSDYNYNNPMSNVAQVNSTSIAWFIARVSTTYYLIYINGMAMSTYTPSFKLGSGQLFGYNNELYLYCLSVDTNRTPQLLPIMQKHANNTSMSQDWIDSYIGKAKSTIIRNENNKFNMLNTFRSFQYGSAGVTSGSYGVYSYVNINAVIPEKCFVTIDATQSDGTPYNDFTWVLTENTLVIGFTGSASTPPSKARWSILEFN